MTHYILAGRIDSMNGRRSKSTVLCPNLEKKARQKNLERQNLEKLNTRKIRILKAKISKKEVSKEKISKKRNIEQKIPQR